MRSVKEKRKYEPVQQRTREDIAAMLGSHDGRQISEALWSATYYDPEWPWVQNELLQHLNHADVWVRRTAATCLGLLAVFHKTMDLELVLSALYKAAEDPEVKSWVEDSLDDIRTQFKLQ